MARTRGFRLPHLTIVAVVAMVLGMLVEVPPLVRHASAVPSVTNPTIADSCGVDTTLVLDASGSINSSHAVEDVRNAAQAFLDALEDTRSTARVTQFGSVSALLAPSTLVDSTSLGANGVLTNALKGYYNPIPPAPPGVALHQYRGSGDPASVSSWQNGSSNQYTNWDQSLKQAAVVPSELVVYVTDGDPTAYDFRGSPGDPFKAGDVGYNTDKSSAAQVTIDRAIEAANTVKSAGTRMLAVGVGNALGSQASQQRLQSISGPQIVRDADLATITSLNQVDVALVTDFADLADFLRSVVLQLCSPSLTIRKLAQSASDSSYRPAPGWAITTTPTTTNGQFTWILPDTAAAVSKTDTTDQDGYAQFQWEPVPSQQDSSAVVSEAVQPGFTPGRPTDTDFTCTLRNDAGDVRVVQGELAVSGTTASLTLPQIGQEIVTCTLFNSFDYDPEIGITKVNSPTAVRGDISPPATVTSAYQVTNEGNTPLSDVHVTDDRCAPVIGVLSAGANVGDTNRDGRLDLTEVWQFSCTRPTVVSRGAAAPAPAPAQNVVNVATATGTDPTGETVDAAASDDVDVYFPGIALTKLVDDPTTADPPAGSVTIALGATVDYTYAVTNTGNTALGTVVLDDDTAPCNNPTPDPANTAAPLLPGQTWNYSCTDVAPPGDVVNTADVTAIPLNPDTGTPFAGNNPPVTATDFAEVDVVNPNIELLKSVDPDVVLLAPDGAPEAVTYTFEATNTGTPALNRPGATSAGAAKDPGWIQDAQCTAPATYVDNGGDANANDLLDPDETWTFTCPGSVDAPTLNIATITAQPADTAGVPLPGVGPVSDLAVALVEVVQPAITIDKTALRGVVLDSGASPVAGPDSPTPRPALYRYEVTNTGNVALVVEPPTDDICAPVDFVDGDTNGDELLDVDETFAYACSTALDRDQNNVGPPPGNLSGVVRNTASVTGVPFFENAPVPDKSVSATDVASVQVIEPGLAIVKTASAAVVVPGTAVTYTYLVRNTGDVGLTLIGPEDNQCAPLVFTGGDRPPFNGILEGADSGGAETFTYTCTRVLDEPPLGETSHLNTVIVGGVDPLGNFYVDSDQAEVRVFEPAISLTKVVSDDLVLTGSTVTYDFAVTNTGTSPVAADDVLADVTLSDASTPATPTCDSPTFVGGDTNGDGLLQRDPREIWTYRCAAAITAPTTDVAVVEGTGGTQFQLPITVVDADSAFVQPFSPAITITKTATPTSLLGSGSVTYTYTVRNTGDVPLADVASRITDDRCSSVTYVSGDEDGDGLLDTINSIFEDALDETWTFTCTTTISATTTNTVVVTGTPTDPVGLHLCGEVAITAAGAARLEADTEPCDVRATAQATVQVVDPATIVITKRTTTPTAQTFAFDLAGQTFELGDGASHTVTGVAPGSYVVAESSTVGWTLIDIACTDASGDSVVTIGELQATIVVSPGELVSCIFTNRPAGTLPSTGAADLVAAALIGTALVGLGAVLVIARRRRRTAH